MKTSVTPTRGNAVPETKKTPWLTPKWQLAFFILGNLLIFVVLYQTLYKIQYSGTGIYFGFANNIFNGQMPYRDFSLEYPPFSLLFLVLPRLGADAWPMYSVYFHIEVIIVNIIGLLLVYGIARRLGKAPWKLLSIYTLCILAIGPIAGEQYDIFPAVMTLAALYFFWTGKTKTSWALLALGAMTKIYPVVIAPVILLYYIRNKQYRQMWSGLVTFAAVCLIILLPFLVLAPDSLWNLVTYHGDRGLQLESTYSSFLLLADKLGLTSVNIAFSFGSWNIVSPLANSLAKFSTYILAGVLLIAYVFIYTRMKPGKSQFTRIGAYSLLLISLVLSASKVFSPQYLIWLVPIIPLILNQWKYAIWLVFVVIGGLTYFIFPLNYLALMDLDTGAVAVLFFRNLLILILAVAAVASLLQMKSSE